MNAAERSTAQTALIKAVAAALDELAMQGMDLPLGDSTIHHMATAAFNVLEALESLESYLAPLLPDQVRDDLGL